MSKKIFRLTFFALLLVLSITTLLFSVILLKDVCHSMHFSRPILAIAAIGTGLSLLLSYRISKSIVKPIKAIDLERSNINNTYDELAPLLSHISMQKRTIARRIKEAERRQEEFRLITENMSEGFLTIDEVGNILTYNSAALKLLKINNPEGGNVLNFNRTQEFRTVVYTALSGTRAESEMSLDSRTYNLIANPVFDDGKIIGAIIVVLDVTESFKREQLRREFTSNVSHELKTPLTSISGFAEIMKSGATDAATVADFSVSIYDEAQRLITLVSDIIKLTELDEGSIEFDRTDIDIYALSEEIISRLAPSAERAGITMKLIGDHASVYGAQKILDEMIYNLCDNAIKYNKHGGTVDVSITTTDTAVEFAVRDSGIGIPQSEQARVFERFYRVDKSHSKEVGGTGLGLSIVKHGAIYHNAQIELESSVGKGTSITVTFNR